MSELTASQTAERLGISRQRVRVLIERGDLPARIGRIPGQAAAYLIPASAVAAFARRRRQPGRPKRRPA